MNIGILIGGSLYWDDAPHRQRWRWQFLQLDRAITVRVPIRYGRNSVSRSNTYTMVYAPNSPLGQAKVAPCRNEITSFEDIVAQAAALWAAEQSKDRGAGPGEPLSAAWGCVGLLPNPNSNLCDQLLDKWGERISRERASGTGARNYDPSRFAVNGIAAIDEGGLLKFPWPERTDGGRPLDGFDLLLATATKPTPNSRTGDFPNVAAIAEAWNKAGDASYFHSNRKHGFVTFQDENIAALLRV